MDEIELQTLSERDQATLAEYLTNGYNGTKAWMKTHPGSSYDAARSSVSEWLTKPNIKAAVETHLADLHMSVEEATKRLTDIARGDIAQIMDVSSVGFNLDMAKAKEQGLTKLIKKVKQKTTTYLAKKESEEDREETVLEVELYSAHEAIRDILKLNGKLANHPSRENVPIQPGTITADATALAALLEAMDKHTAAAVERSRAVDASATDTRNEIADDESG